MKTEKTLGMFLVLGGILSLIAVLTHFIFDNYSADTSPYISAILFILIGLNAIYSGYRMCKKV